MGHLFVEWLFDIFQVAAVILVWELEKFFWRLATGTSRLTRDPKECRVSGMKIKHVVIAMNPVTGMSLVRHKRLPRKKTVIVCSREEAERLLAGQDIHELSVHVAGDSINIPIDTGIFYQVLTTCTDH